MNHKATFIILLFFGGWVLIGCQSTVASTPTIEPTPIPTSAPVPLTNSILLHVPAYPDLSHKYYVDLLVQALADIGYKADITWTSPIAQVEAVDMLDKGEISLMHLIGSQERDEKYIRVPVGLTDGLIANRILLVRSGDSDAYEEVETLDDFRDLQKVGGFGAAWFDAKVWEVNNLPYEPVDGEWRVIYDMLADPDSNIDYFSRGFTEIAVDARNHRNLDVEQHLVLIYDRDFYFYLNSDLAEYEPILTEALQKAHESGLIERLKREYWASDFEWLNFDNRTKIYLETPE